MQIIIECIRKTVILVLLMELVLQLQSGKQYESYINVLVGIMVIYSVVQGVFGVLGKSGEELLAPMQDFRWQGNWDVELQEERAEAENSEESEPQEIRVEPVQIDIQIEEICIDDIANIGGIP